MKKTYKVKEKNKTKLKAYLKNEPINKRSRSGDSNKHNSIKRGNLQ
tara:strand:+ start:283 stop:420 length:138 start_codon:yes stop_codon:yes gene_type:complete